MGTTESSVLTNLNELFAVERHRVDEERERAERERRTLAERRAAELAERKRVEAEARARAEAERLAAEERRRQAEREAEVARDRDRRIVELRLETERLAHLAAVRAGDASLRRAAELDAAHVASQLQARAANRRQRILAAVVVTLCLATAAGLVLFIREQRAALAQLEAQRHDLARTAAELARARSAPHDAAASAATPRATTSVAPATSSPAAPVAPTTGAASMRPRAHRTPPPSRAFPPPPTRCRGPLGPLCGRPA